MDRKFVSKLPHIVSDLRFINEYLHVMSRYSKPTMRGEEMIYGLQTTIVAMICEWQEFVSNVQAAARQKP